MKFETSTNVQNSNPQTEFKNFEIGILNLYRIGRKRTLRPILGFRIFHYDIQRW